MCQLLVADQIWELEEREIMFRDIVTFVNKETRAASHPIFGNLSPNYDKSRNKLQDTKFKSQSKVLRSNPSTSSGASFGTISTKTEKETNSKSAHQDAGKKLWRCLLCSSQHNLNYCADFKKKPYPARVDFVKEKGLCFNCLCPSAYG